MVIHRAIFGSFERFIAILIEHFAGAFPTWLAPEQVRVLPISEKSLGYAEAVGAALRAAGARATVDGGNDRIQAKVKVGADLKIPYLLVVGPKDQDARAVSVRLRGVQKDLGAMPLDEFVAGLTREIATRGGETAAQRLL